MTSKLKIVLVFMFVFAIFLTSCNDMFNDCVDGNNRIAREDRSIGSFSSVATYGNFVVDISIGSEERLSVETDDNLLQYIETYIQGNTLVIESRNNRCLRSSEPIQVFVVASDIEKLKLAGTGIMYCNNLHNEDLSIELPGSGNIECHSINVDFLSAKISGSGIIELWGKATTSDLILTGSGAIKSFNLNQETCYGNISGSGIIQAAVSSKLDVTITGSGNFYYEGDPVVTQSITGSGAVRKY
jgi:hypothetical protein